MIRPAFVLLDVAAVLAAGSMLCWCHATTPTPPPTTTTTFGPKYELKFQNELDNSTIIKEIAQQQVFKCQVRLAPVIQQHSYSLGKFEQHRARLKSSWLLAPQADHLDLVQDTISNHLFANDSSQQKWSTLLNVTLTIDWLKDERDILETLHKDQVLVVNVTLKSQSQRADKSQRNRTRLEIKNTLNNSQLKLTSRLKITQLKATDSGRYKCLARASFAQLVPDDSSSSSAGRNNKQKVLLVEQSLDSNGANLVVGNATKTSNNGASAQEENQRRGAGKLAGQKWPPTSGASAKPSSASSGHHQELSSTQQRQRDSGQSQSFVQSQSNGTQHAIGDQSGLGEVSSEDIAALWASNADDGADDSTSMGGHQSVGPEPTAPAGGQNQFEDDEDLYRIDLDRMEPINGRQQQQPQQPAHANDIQDQEDGRPQVTSSLDLDGIIIGGESQEAAGLDGLIDNEVIGVGNNESSQSTTANEAGGKLDPSTTGLRVPIVNWNSSSLNNGADRRGGGGPVVWLHAHTNAPKVATTIDSTRQRLARFVHKIAPELGCFTGLGEHYRGNVSTSSDNRPCLNWLRVRLFRFHQVEADKGAAKGQAGPSLLSLALSPSDNHNYCRNPNMDPHGPWCFVAYSERLDGPQLAGQAHQQQQGRGHMMIASTRLGSSVKFVGRPCDVAPCSEYLWLYIVAPPLGLLVLLTCLVGVLVCSIRKSHYNAIFSAQQRACKGAKTGASSMGRLLMGSRGRFAPKKFGCSPAAKRNKTTNYLDDDIFEIVDDIDFCDGQTHSSSLSPKSSESLKLNSSANNHEPTTASEQVDAFCQQQKPKHSNLNHCKSVNPIFADRPLATGTSSKQHQHHHKQQLRSGGPMFATLRCHVRGTLQRVSQQQQQQQLVQDKSSSFIEQCDLATNNSSKFKLAACDWIAASPSSSSSSSSSSSAPAANSDKHIPNNTNETTKTSHLISCSSSSSTNAITSEPSAITAGRKSTTNFSENCILGTDLPHLNAYNISIAYDQQPIYEGKFSQVQAAFIKQQQDDTTQATGLIGAQVAVCSLKQQSTLDDSVFEPANLKLRNLNHLNILKLIGYAKFEDEIGLNKRSNACVLIYDMAHLIDLCDWLKEQNKDSIISNGDPANELSLRQNLTCFAKQIALALDYLHDRNIVYKDLACRNCFIDVTKMLVKLASFNIELEIDDTNGETNRNILNLKSMIRPKYLLDYYVIDSRPSECQLLPLSWIPLESILFNKFNKQTDVWSFGCLLYELFSLGEVAYFGYSSKQVIDSVRSNLMPPQALLCPNGVYKLMCKCLSDIPTLRPNVKQIYEELNLYSGQCSSFLDHHLCSLATAMCNQPKEEPLVGSAQQQHVAMRIQSTKGTGSITKTKSYANIGDYSPSAPPPPSSSGRFKSEQEQLFSSSNGNDIANQFNRTDASSQNRPETSVGKIPLSKSINLGASRLARPFVMPNSGKNAPSDDANQYDEPIIDIKKT